MYLYGLSIWIVNNILPANKEERMFNFLESSADWKPNIILVNNDQATYSA